MEREIKFRAWSFHNKEMYQGNSPYPAPYHFQIYGNGNIGYCPTFESDDKDLTSFYTNTEPEYEKQKIAVMQYTGRKDKNVKEIYEGDLVKTDSGAIMKVCYRDDMCRFVLRFNDHSASSDLDNDLEVIGNIYENPELLNNQK